MFRKLMCVVVATSLVGIAAGCAVENAPSFVKWPVGLRVIGQEGLDQIAKSYKQNLGQGAVEQKGTINSGSFAGQTTGTLEVRTTAKKDITKLVVGETQANNPLVPGWDNFSDTPVFMVEEVEFEFDQITHSIEQTFEEQQQGVLFGYHSENLGYGDPSTTASTYGWAGDEYVVQIGDLTVLWNPQWEVWEMYWEEDRNENADALDKHGDFAGLQGSFEYMVQSNASVGDTWVHPDGHTFYRAVAKEDVQIGGMTVGATKIELRKTTPEDTMDIANRCLKELNDQDVAFTTQGVPPGFDHSDTFPTMHLNPGCEGSFTHHKIGHEWWYQNVLVRSETTEHMVTVKDFGWEWLQQTAPGAPIERMTAKVKTAASANAIGFVEFDYTNRTETWQANTWEVLNFQGITNAIN